MPVTYRVDPERNVILATAEGTLTLEDVQSYVSSVLTDLDARPGINELLDFRQVKEVAMAPLDLPPVADIARVFTQGIKQTRSAFVASRENEVVILALFRLIQEILPNEVRFFVDWSAAQEWLGLAPDRPERRSAPRKEVLLSVLCGSGIHQAPGKLLNISLSGALIESKTTRPRRAQLVRIRFYAPEIDEEIVLIGTADRPTTTGFAIRFRYVTKRLRRLLS